MTLICLARLEACLFAKKKPLKRCRVSDESTRSRIMWLSSSILDRNACSSASIFAIVPHTGPKTIAQEMPDTMMMSVHTTVSTMFFGPMSPYPTEVIVYVVKYKHVMYNLMGESLVLTATFLSTRSKPSIHLGTPSISSTRTSVNAHKFANQCVRSISTQENLSNDKVLYVMDMRTSNLLNNLEARSRRTNFKSLNKRMVLTISTPLMSRDPDKAPIKSNGMIEIKSMTNHVFK
mmetsp:Transcript_69558/g.213248  ORF Transcript_69558/g.213248 Transcript_69558/m.213248 type:complete len:234 (+) Transcript_69558:724-1425(+)